MTSKDTLVMSVDQAIQVLEIATKAATDHRKNFEETFKTMVALVAEAAARKGR